MPRDVMQLLNQLRDNLHNTQALARALGGLFYLGEARWAVFVEYGGVDMSKHTSKRRVRTHA